MSEVEVAVVIDVVVVAVAVEVVLVVRGEGERRRMEATREEAGGRRYRVCVVWKEGERSVKREVVRRGGDEGE